MVNAPQHQIKASSRALFVTLANEAYLPIVRILLTSAFKNSGWEGDYMLLAHDTPDEKLSWFKENGVIIKHCAPLFDEPVGGMHPVLTSKFYMFTDEFKQWDTIVYVDGDSLITGPLHHLADVKGFHSIHDVGQRLSSQIHQNAANHPKPLRELIDKYDLTDDCFCAGFFAFSPKDMPKTTFQDMIELSKKYTGVSAFGEQLMFNLYFHDKWKRLPGIYNVQDMNGSTKWYTATHKTPGLVIHFCGANKPWVLKTGPLAKLWATWDAHASQTIIERRQVKPWSQKKIDNICKKLVRRQKKYYQGRNWDFFTPQGAISAFFATRASKKEGKRFHWRFRIGHKQKHPTLKALLIYQRYSYDPQSTFMGLLYSCLPNIGLSALSKYLRFNWSCYISNYPKRLAPYHDPKKAFKHWLTIGRKQGLTYKWGMRAHQIPRNKIRFLITATQDPGNAFICNELKKLDLTGLQATHPEQLQHQLENKNTAPKGITSGAELEEQLDHAFLDTTSSNNVEGFQLTWDTLERYVQSQSTLETKEERNVEMGKFLAKHINADKFIHFERRNLFYQAIAALNNTPKKKDFNFTQAENLILQYKINRKAWYDFYESKNVVPMVVYYEDFMKDYDYTMRVIIDYIGIPLPEGYTLKKPSLPKTPLSSHMICARLVAWKIFNRAKRALGMKAQAANSRQHQSSKV